MPERTLWTLAMSRFKVSAKSPEPLPAILSLIDFPIRDGNDHLQSGPLPGGAGDVESAVPGSYPLLDPHQAERFRGVDLFGSDALAVVAYRQFQAVVLSF